MSRVIVTKEIAQVGMSVMRGKDWIFGDQDGVAGSRGIIRSKSNDHAVVKWDSGKEYVYRIGHDGKFDLYVYMASPRTVNQVETEPYSYFKRGDIVYVGDSNIEWVSNAKLEVDIPYTVKESRQSSIQLVGSDYWIPVRAFISQAEWMRRPYKPKGVVEQVKPSLGEIRSSLESFSKMSEAKEIFKPNTNRHGNDRNNTGPIKVRRPSCIIKGPEKRTRAFF